MRQDHAQVQHDLATTRQTLAELEQRRADTARAVGELTASRHRVAAELKAAREQSMAVQQQLAVLSSELESRRNELARLEVGPSASSGPEDLPLETGSTPIAQGSTRSGHQVYRCNDDGSGWICSAGK
jgi:septal ring factor EnvC (AmiA/AmiB activator)